MLLSKLAHNPDRNNLLVRLVGLCRKKGRKTALISERTEQLASVQALASNVLPGDKVGYFCRSLTRSVWQNRKRSRETTRTFTAAELDVAKKNSDVLLATYGMLRQGTDIPDLSALIYGTPQSDPRQSKGRTERYVEGKLPPVVVCIVDTYYPKCITWAEEQERHFLRSGMRVYWKEAADVIR
jgi:superfamily II DNA or RNA helicase